MEDEHQKIVILLCLGLIILFAFNFSSEDTPRVEEKPRIENHQFEAPPERNFEVIEEPVEEMELLD